MARRSKSLIYLLIVCVSCSSVSHKNNTVHIYNPSTILFYMDKVYKWQINHPVKRNEGNGDNWARAAMYSGIMSMYQITDNQIYLDQAMQWASNERHWMVGDRRRHADDQACGQVYLDIYFVKKEPVMIEDVQNVFDEMIKNPLPGRNEWHWCDALFMAPPVLARLGAATAQKKYYDLLNTLYWDATDFLFDKEEKLFYRDKNFFNARTVNGKKIFWSRGNGWVMGGLVQILQHLPKTDIYYKRYEELLKQMANAVVKQQDADGLWHPSLLDKEQSPYAETSGSGFFCYALAWGINNGYLSKKKYLPIVNKSWQGLVNAIHPEGKLGWVQQIGDRPEKVTKENNQEYGTGAFLLAGSEMYKLKS